MLRGKSQNNDTPHSETVPDLAAQPGNKALKAFIKTSADYFGVPLDNVS